MMDTGLYFRAKRDGKWQPVDVLQMTEEEMTEILKDRPSTFPAGIIIHLTGIINKLTEGVEHDD